ncbi:hypothetical protein F5887DRAFT_1000145 [Amanita rubescens]|nr:hypothetical protein F5887DRAFT_1000145 [Amanita rubescens]
MTNGLNVLAAQVANLTNTVNDLTNVYVDPSCSVNEANTMSPIRMHNASASSSGVLRYPDGAPVNQLPHTKTDAIQLSGPQAAAAAAALGLDPLPENATALQKRRQFLDYIGVFV